MYDRKLIVVQNPYSTRHREVQAGVFDRLNEADIAYDTITTRFSRAEDNIKDLADRLPDGAHIISAAGDGTSTQVVNAGLRAELDGAVYSFIGYGNCNDLARGQRDPLPLLQANRHTITHQPLSIEVNGEPWRCAPGYMTTRLDCSDCQRLRQRSIARTHAPYPTPHQACAQHGASCLHLSSRTRYLLTTLHNQSFC